MNSYSPAISIDSVAPVQVSGSFVSLDEILASQGSVSYAISHIYLSTTDIETILNPIVITSRDANGNSRTFQLNLTVDPNQSNLTVFENVCDLGIIFDGNTSIEITMPPESSTELYFYTSEMNPSYLLPDTQIPVFDEDFMMRAGLGENEMVDAQDACAVNEGESPIVTRDFNLPWSEVFIEDLPLEGETFADIYDSIQDVIPENFCDEVEPPQETPPAGGGGGGNIGSPTDPPENWNQPPREPAPPQTGDVRYFSLSPEDAANPNYEWAQIVRPSALTRYNQIDMSRNGMTVRRGDWLYRAGRKRIEASDMPRWASISAGLKQRGAGAYPKRVMVEISAQRVTVLEWGFDSQAALTGFPSGWIDRYNLRR